MTKQIDFSKPLSDEDARYVLDRPWLIQNAELNGEEVTFADEFSVDAEDGQPEDETPEGQSDDPNAVNQDPEDDQDEDDEDTEAVDYSTWEYADLKDEAGKRELSKAGSKEQLIARLEEDDAAAEAEDAETEDDSAE